MRSTQFWIFRFLGVAAGAFALLVLADLLKGETLENALWSAMIWALISAGVFVAVRNYKARKGEACALCRDTVED